MTNESANSGGPPAVDRATFQAELDALRVREKAHTREGDAIAAARRRLPMTEVDASLTLTGPNGPVTLLDAFEGRRVLRRPDRRALTSPSAARTSPLLPTGIGPEPGRFSL